MTDTDPLPVVVTGLTDRSSVICMLEASLESAGLSVPVLGLDPARAGEQKRWVGQAVHSPW